jgi:hypothetical protein
MATAAHILSQYSIPNGYSSSHTVTIQRKAWLQQLTYCQNTAYSMAIAAHILSQYSMVTAAHILSQYSIKHGYSSSHTVTIQHKAWLQQLTSCHNTAYSMATAAHILSQYSIQHGYSSSHTVTIHHGYSSSHSVTIQHTAWLQQLTYCHNTA